MQDKSYVPFTEEMKREYTVLVPNMLPMHFKLIISVLETYGLHMELLQNEGPQIAETGLKYTHNDACYPAILVSASSWTRCSRADTIPTRLR